jgi:hypothetical protein
VASQVGGFGKINLFLAAYQLAVLNGETFIRLEAPCQVLAAKCGRTTAFDINLQLPARNSTSTAMIRLRLSFSQEGAMISSQRYLKLYALFDSFPLEGGRVGWGLSLSELCDVNPHPQLSLGQALALPLLGGGNKLVLEWI